MSVCDFPLWKLLFFGYWLIGRIICFVVLKISHCIKPLKKRYYFLISVKLPLMGIWVARNSGDLFRLASFTCMLKCTWNVITDVTWPCVVMRERWEEEQLTGQVLSPWCTPFPSCLASSAAEWCYLGGWVEMLRSSCARLTSAFVKLWNTGQASPPEKVKIRERMADRAGALTAMSLFLFTTYCMRTVAMQAVVGE